MLPRHVVGAHLETKKTDTGDPGLKGIDLWKVAEGVK